MCNISGVATKIVAGVVPSGNIVKQESTRNGTLSVPEKRRNGTDRENAANSERKTSILSWTMSLVWPLMSTLPLVLTSTPLHYSKIFPTEWYTYEKDSPKPLGLILGITAVVVGHLFLVPLFYFYRNGSLGVTPLSVQSKGARQYDFMEGLKTHLTQPEGFVLLGGYLSFTWMYNLMPESYYSFEHNIQWSRVFLCLVIQDTLQYIMHRLEHVVSPEVYKKSHKPHHTFTNPRLFDAFNGSVPDTVLMILIPLFLTAHIVRDCNVWTYMSFGSMYANWLVLIHSEYVMPWDSLFHKIGFGTSGDHHVHHKVFKYNFGHLFMWSDQIAGTYRSPKSFAPKLFRATSQVSS